MGQGNDEKRSDSRRIWKVEPKGLANRLHRRRERGIQGDSKLWGLNNENEVVIHREDYGEEQCRGTLWGAQSWARCLVGVPTEALSGQLEIGTLGSGAGFRWEMQTWVSSEVM